MSSPSLPQESFRFCAVIGSLAFFFPLFIKMIMTLRVTRLAPTPPFSIDQGKCYLRIPTILMFFKKCSWDKYQVWFSCFAAFFLMPAVLDITLSRLRPHPYLNKQQPKLIVHIPGVFKHPVNPL